MRKLAFALFALTVLLFLVSQAHAQNMWICGTVTSEPVSAMYGITVYSFNFQVTSSSEALAVNNLTCLWLSEPVNGNSYNFSGILLSDVNGSLPVGAFMVYSVNPVTASNMTSNNGSDWTWTFRQIWSALGTVGNLLATFVVQIIQTTTGYSLSLFMASLLVLFLMGAFFLFLGKKLPWWIDLLGFVVFIAVCSTLFSSL